MPLTSIPFVLVRMLLLAGARILKPHLRHPLAQSGAQRYPLQILSVRVIINLEAAVQHLQLLLRERRSHAFALLFAAHTVVARSRFDFHRFHVVLAAQDLIAQHRKLFARGQLPIACVAREARQMVDGVTRLSHPIAGTDFAAAFRTVSNECSALGWRTTKRMRKMVCDNQYMMDP